MTVVRAGGWVFTSGVTATDGDGIAAEARPNPANPFASDELELQARCVLRELGKSLAEAGCDIAHDVARIWQWVPAPYPSDADFVEGPLVWPSFRDITPYARVAKEVMTDFRRASTGIGVRALPVPGALLAIDLIAIEGGGEKVAFDLDGAVADHGAYAPATRVGDWVFLAGFGATDFKGDWMSSVHMGEPSLIAPEARVNPYIWLGSEIETQTEYTLERLAQLAELAGSSLERCVRADVTLGHPSDYYGFERVWRRWFPDDPPARSLVTGARIVVKGLRVEIALILLASDSALERTAVGTAEIPAPFGHHPHAIRAGDFLFVSTLLPVDGAGGVPRSLRPFRGAAKLQSRVLLERLGTICAAAGTSLEHVCKIQAFFRDIDNASHLVAAFPAAAPALTALEPGGPDPLLVPGAQLHLDAIAYVP
jgi:enamine deaminase RidA (YjgF/YER057c/UK114 family)